MQFIKKLLFFILIFTFFNTVTNGQQHYIIEIDRINDIKTYKKLQFDKGNAKETKCPIPTLENGDIITVRMINFNELIYAFDVKTNFKEKEQSTLSKVVNNAAPILDLVSLGGSISFLQKLTATPPAAIENNITRGLGDEANVNNIYKKLTDIVSSVARNQSSYLNLVSSEGISIDSLKESINELSFKISTENEILNKNYSDIKNLFEEIGDENQNTLEYKRLKYYLDNYDTAEIEVTSSKIASLNKLLVDVDFIQERTFIVTGKTENSELFFLDAIVYKRENIITEKAGLLPYYSVEESRINGDQIRQNFRVDFKVKHKNRLYFNFSINQIIIPKNRNLISTNQFITNDPIEGVQIDSFRFISNEWGSSSKTSFGMNVNYDLPDFISSLKTSCLIGYSMIFNNSQNLGDAISVKKGFLMTGFSIKPTKFQYLALSFGCAWSKYDYLTSKYQVDKNYSSLEYSEDERKLAIGQKVKPAFFLGINVNL